MTESMSRTKCKVWTPLKSPPAPSSVHSMSDDAYLVISALREANRKRLEKQQRKQPNSRPYYHKIYSESFKTEPDDGHEDVKEGVRTQDRVAQSIIPQFPASNQSVMPSRHQEVARSRLVNQPSDQIPSTSSNIPIFIKEEVMDREDDFLEGNFTPSVNHGASTSGTYHAVPTPSCGINNGADYSMFASVKQYNTAQSAQSTHASSMNMIENALHSTSIHSDGTIGKQMSSAKASVVNNNHTRNVQAGSCTGADQRPMYMYVPTVSKPSPLSETYIANSNYVPMIQTGNTSNDIFQNAHPKPESLPANLLKPKSKGDVEAVGEKGKDHVTKVDVHHSKMMDQTRIVIDTHPSSAHSGCIKEAGTSGRLLPAARSSSSDVKQPAPVQNSVLTPTKRKIIPTFTNRISGQKDKAKRRLMGSSQMTLEQVMGVGSRSENVPLSSASWESIDKWSPSQLHLWQQKACEAEQILMTLLYTDGSSQLREIEEIAKRVRRTSNVHVDGKASCILLAIQNKGETGSSCSLVTLPLSFNSQDGIGHIRPVLLAVLESRVKKVCFDAQELMHTVVVNYQLMPQMGCNKWEILDPKVASWLLDPDNPPYTFSQLMDKHLPGKYTRFSPDMHASHEIHGADVVLLGLVMRDLSKMLDGKKLWQLYTNIEVRLIPILAAMEVQGIRVNSETLKKYGVLLKENTKKAEAQCYEAAGHSFQINSHVQLRQVLFEELKLDEQCPDTKLARTNVQNLKSTSETVLLKLKGVHPLPELVLNYRQLVKLKSTYIDGIADYVCGGYIHTSWDQTSAASGRLQSANPNVQNIPKNPINLQEMDKKNIQGGTTNTTGPTLWMRAPFISHDGWSLLAADFQSIELRILAHLSQDPVLLSVFNDKRGIDIFVQLTCEWLGMQPDNVKSQDRERTKRIVYSVIYGVGPERLAETLNDSKENAKSFTKSFLAKFKAVNSFTHRCIFECQRQGCVKTLFGRQRLIRDINSQNFHVRSHAERQAVNFVVQGSAADLCKLAMIHTMAELSQRERVRARLLVQIHDELLFEVHDEDVAVVKGILKNVMESPARLCGEAVHLKVPLSVSLSVGKTWGHLKPT